MIVPVDIQIQFLTIAFSLESNQGRKFYCISGKVSFESALTSAGSLQRAEWRWGRRFPDYTTSQQDRGSAGSDARAIADLPKHVPISPGSSKRGEVSNTKNFP